MPEAEWTAGSLVGTPELFARHQIWLCGTRVLTLSYAMWPSASR
jgi:hypothetical protein